MAKTIKTVKWKKKRYLLAVVMLAAVLFAAALYDGLTVSVHTLYSEKLNEGQKVEVLLITDLHSSVYGDNQQALINKIKAEKPDLILMAGDIVDDKRPILGTQQLLEGLLNTAPIYYVTGNHEYWSGECEEIKDWLREYGVIVLEDEVQEVIINGVDLAIAGLEDPARKTDWPRYNTATAAREAFENLEEVPGYKILLAHRPELIRVYQQHPFDLVVSGHAHGGQVRIPFLLEQGLYTPGQGFFPKYTKGAFIHGNLTHIISRGLHKGMLPRVFNPPELVKITLLPLPNDKTD